MQNNYQNIESVAQEIWLMNVLFLVYHGFDDASGITKKIHYQVKGLRENGHEVHLCYYDFDQRRHRCRFIDDQVIRDYGTGKLAALRQRFDYDCIYEYCKLNGIQFVYARCFMNADPILIRFFKRLKQIGIKTVMEIPTYPYDQEYLNSSWDIKLKLMIDRLFRNWLSKEMTAIVTFSDEERIFGQRTIRISNGVDFDSIPLHQYQAPADGSIHLVGVAEVHIWHGYDRLIAGLGEYYHHTKYGIQDKIIFHGQLFGDALDKVFNQSCFAIGSLARHRSGITIIKTLKNREYATRGIPFIYSEQDSDFDNQPYVIKASPDESPINVQQILDFIDHHQFKPEEIRKKVDYLSWKIQMQKVIDEA